MNEDLPDLTDVANKTPIPIGGKIELKGVQDSIFKKMVDVWLLYKSLKRKLVMLQPDF